MEFEHALYGDIGYRVRLLVGEPSSSTDDVAAGSGVGWGGYVGGLLIGTAAYEAASRVCIRPLRALIATAGHHHAR